MLKALLPLLLATSVNGSVDPIKAADGSYYGLVKEGLACLKGDDCDDKLACQNILINSVDKLLCIPQA
jgi:hypothetical protein